MIATSIIILLLTILPIKLIVLFSRTPDKKYHCNFGEYVLKNPQF
jgi:hypothetical protein